MFGRSRVVNVNKAKMQNNETLQRERCKLSKEIPENWFLTIMFNCAILNEPDEL